MEKETNQKIKEAVHGLIREGLLNLPSFGWPGIVDWIDRNYPAPFGSPNRDYFEYMNSDDWKEERRKQLGIHGYRCEICGSTNDLQVHHISYERGEHPSDEDCAVLCRDCHRKLHYVIDELKNHEIFELKTKYDKWRSGIEDKLGVSLSNYINKAWPGGIKGANKLRTVVIIRHTFTAQNEDYYLRVSPSHTSLLRCIKKK